MTDLTEHQRRAYLDAMGVELWLPRDEPDLDPPPEASPAGANTLDWDELRDRVAACTRCELHRGRTQTVFGVGNPNASWMIVGEAPGAEEDRRGEPFVGRAGKLLDEMLRALGMAREDVFIANILKCRPPNNRDPKADEVAQCREYLERQIALVDPSIVIAVGRIAAQNLLGTDSPVGRLRGRRHSLGDVPLVVTYHPAYLLRSPSQKRKAWEDLSMARAIASESARGPA